MGTPDDIAAQLAALSAPVRLVFFTQTFGCNTCLTARQVVDQIASLSEQITVEEHNIVLDKEKVSEYGIERVPTLAIVGEHDPGIRYCGVPAGYELASIVDAIMLVARGEAGLTKESLASLAALDRQVEVKVFVTPT